MSSVCRRSTLAPRGQRVDGPVPLRVSRGRRCRDRRVLPRRAQQDPPPLGLGESRLPVPDRRPAGVCRARSPRASPAPALTLGGRRRPGALLGDELLRDLVGGGGMGEEVALREVAAELASEASWPSDSMPSAIATRPSACARLTMLAVIAASLGVVLDALHERAVDLDHVDREAAQLRERREAGAEVVDRDAHALRRAAPAARAGAVAGGALGDDRGLGHLEAELARLEPLRLRARCGRAC